jgi:hypothetical protein
VTPAKVGPGLRSFVYPLRMAAFLSAAGVKAEPELEKIRLLGAERPLRAFVGHVEPTFDWTLRDPTNKQVLTHVMCAALYDKLYEGYQRYRQERAGHARLRAL